MRSNDFRVLVIRPQSSLVSVHAIHDRQARDMQDVERTVRETLQNDAGGLSSAVGPYIPGTGKFNKRKYTLSWPR